MIALTLFGALVIAASVAFVVWTVRRDREAEAVRDAAFEAWLAARGQEHELPVRVVVISAGELTASVLPAAAEAPPALPEVSDR
jgi:CHASE2 domain-containing sensor protein